jgi:hypothetical protein
MVRAVEQPAAPLARLYRDGCSLSIAHDGCLNTSSGHGFLNEARELTCAAHSLAVELDDDVSCFQAGSSGRAFLGHFLDDDATGLAGFRIRGTYILNCHTDLAPAPPVHNLDGSRRSNGSLPVRDGRNGRTCAGGYC